MCVGGGMGGVSLKMFVGIGIWVPRFPPLTVLTVQAYIVWVRVSACLSLALHLLCLHKEVAGDYIYIAVKSVRDSEIMQCLTEQAKWEKHIKNVKPHIYGRWDFLCLALNVLSYYKQSKIKSIISFSLCLMAFPHCEHTANRFNFNLIESRSVI